MNYPNKWSLALGLLLGFATITTPALADDVEQEGFLSVEEAVVQAFDFSDRRCQEEKNLACIKVNEPGVTIVDVIEIFNKRGFNITFPKVHAKNGWGDEVNETTFIIPGKEFVLLG